MAEGSEDEGDKTEEPSQKKLDDAVERGDVVKSQEVSSFFVLGAATLTIALFAQGMGRDLVYPLAAFLDHAHQIAFDRTSLIGVYVALAKIVATVLGLPLLVFMIAAIAGNMIQHRLVWTTEPIMPKLSKVSPLAGVKRLFSAESLSTFVKGIVKIVVVGTAMAMAVAPELRRLDTIVATDTIGLLAVTQRLAVRVMIAVLIVMGIVAALDYLFQRHRWMSRLRMTRQELKEEFKQQEGSPEIKAKVRQIRQARSRKRMMAAVPSATVVVTNPTHFAVALKYEPGMRAPICVAKGVDDIALKIREVARLHEVAVVENPPLARTLYAAVEIDGEIPEEHYKAVAELVGYVMKLDSRKGWRPD